MTPCSSCLQVFIYDHTLLIFPNKCLVFLLSLVPALIFTAPFGNLGLFFPHLVFDILAKQKNSGLILLVIAFCSCLGLAA